MGNPLVTMIEGAGRLTAVLALCLCVLPLHAKPVTAVGAQIDLPFEYTLLRTEDGRSAGRMVSATQRQELEVRDAAGGKQKIVLVAVYVAPDHITNHLMEEVADKDASEAALKPGVRGSGDFKIDGFRFHFIDGPIKNEEYPQHMAISGVVNGALYRIAVLASDQRLLTPELALRMKAIRLDYAGLLKIKADFEEEARMAVQDNALDTPLSRLMLDKGTQARLSSSYLKTGGDGVPLFRSRTFGLFKAGMWTLQSLSLFIGCGREDSFEDEKEIRSFLLMTGEGEEEDKEDRYTQITSPTSATMLGLRAETATAKGGKVNAMRSTVVRRWLARNEGNVFNIGIERLNGSPVEKLVVGQLESAPPMCQLQLQFGSRPTQ
jgi:hypothetical protein